MKYKGIIFDLDGTLADSLSDLAFSMNETLKRFGFGTHPTPKYKIFVGNGVRHLIKAVLPKDKEFDDEFLDEFGKEYAKIYEIHKFDSTKAYDGIAEMLAEVKQKGLKIAVLSNKPDKFTVEMVRTIFGPDIFDMILGQSDKFGRKPSPDGALIIAEKLGLKPGEMLFVGDSKTDMQTAKAAGMCAVGVLWGFRDEAELRENGADYIVTAPGEITGLIG